MVTMIFEKFDKNRYLNNTMDKLTYPRDGLYSYYTLGRGENMHTYIDIGMCIDIETSSTEIDGKKLSWSYHQQLGFYHTNYQSRNIDELINAINNICDWLELLPSKPRIICLVHNLGYEFTYLSQYLDFKEVFAKSRTSILKAVYRNIEFRCSYAFSNMNLKLLSETYTDTTKNKELIDHTLIRYPETALTENELKYNFCDTEILLEFWYMHVLPEFIHKSGRAWLPLTNTAKVRKDMRRRIKDWKRYKNAYHHIYPTEQMYNILVKCFYGGIVRCNARFTGKLMEHSIASRDGTSQYPSVQFHEFYPLGRWYRVDPKEKLDENNLGIYLVEFWNLKPKYDIHPMPCDKAIAKSEVIYDNGRVYSAKYIKIYLTSVDFEIFVRFYRGKYKILEMYVSRKSRLPKFMIESLFDYFSGKQKLKGVKGMEDVYLKKKNMLNSNFGCCVQKHNDMELNWDNNTSEWTEEKKDYKEDRNEFLPYAVGVFITAYARKKLLNAVLEIYNDGGTVVYMDTDSIKYLYDGGIHEHIFDKLDIETEMKTKEICNIYGLDFETIKSIGKWDLETSKYDGNVYPSFKTLGSKRWAHFDSPYKTYTDAKNVSRETLDEWFECMTPTLSGLPKEGWKNYVIRNPNTEVAELFSFGTVIPADICCKTAMTYIYNQDDLRIDYEIDGVTHYLNTQKNFVHAKPVGFKIGLGKDYGKYLKLLSESTERNKKLIDWSEWNG